MKLDMNAGKPKKSKRAAPAKKRRSKKSKKAGAPAMATQAGAAPVAAEPQEILKTREMQNRMKEFQDGDCLFVHKVAGGYAIKSLGSTPTEKQVKSLGDEAGKKHRRRSKKHADM